MPIIKEYHLSGWGGDINRINFDKLLKIDNNNLFKQMDMLDKINGQTREEEGESVEKQTMTNTNQLITIQLIDNECDGIVLNLNFK